jgi:uncharacterized protein (UPF0548 family)
MRPFFRKPSPGALRAFLDAQAGCDFTYAAVGGTKTTPPEGYRVNHTRVEIGRGEEAYRAGCEALRGWRQVDLGWIQPWPAAAELRPGMNVSLLARSLSLWWLSACRIVYTVNDDGPPSRFGFAYGTLPAHIGSGEERFLVERDSADVVWYDLLAFSRPRGLLAHLGYPWMRRTQRRFGRDSAKEMLAAVAEHWVGRLPRIPR